MEHFCKLQDITCVSATPFQSHHEARTVLPLTDILNDRFFNNVRDNLRAGDQIAICRYDTVPGNHHATRLVEFCVVRVTEKTVDGVKLFVVQPVVGIAADSPEVLQQAEASRERYIEGSGEVRWNPGRKCYELRCNGEVLITDIPREDKEQALAIARGDAPLPADLKAAA
jgi:hypothetical protein